MFITEAEVARRLDVGRWIVKRARHMKVDAASGRRHFYDENKLGEIAAHIGMVRCWLCDGHVMLGKHVTYNFRVAHKHCAEDALLAEYEAMVGHAA